MKKNILLIISVIINIVFIVLALVYALNPIFDYAVIDYSLPRLCDYAEKTDTDLYKNIEICHTNDITDKNSSYLTETHSNRLFTINYPENWRAITNESNGLMEIKQPVDDHAIIDITYIDERFDDINRCDLSSRNWLELKSTIVDEIYSRRLVRYEGKNKLKQPEIALVAISGVENFIHDCSIIDLKATWASDKDIASQIINSVKLNK